MLTAYQEWLVHVLIPKQCQGINCYGAILLAEAKSKPRVRLEIQQY